jgi:hypothetical protein
VALLAGACRAGNELPGPISPEEYAIYGVLADSLYAGNKDSVTDLGTSVCTISSTWEASMSSQISCKPFQSYHHQIGIPLDFAE